MPSNCNTQLEVRFSSTSFIGKYTRVLYNIYGRKTFKRKVQHPEQKIFRCSENEYRKRFRTSTFNSTDCSHQRYFEVKKLSHGISQNFSSACKNTSVSIEELLKWITQMRTHFSGGQRRNCSRTRHEGIWGSEGMAQYIFHLCNKWR